MPKIIFIESGGARKEVEAVNGDSLMVTAQNAGIDSIIAECGGCCTCATCHCYIADDWIDRLDKPDEFEDDMLELTEAGREAGSRLSCQVTITDELDGLEVRVPDAQ